VAEAITLAVATVEDRWTQYRVAIDSMVRRVLSPQKFAKKPWISQNTHHITIEQHRTSIASGNLAEYTHLAAPRRCSLRHMITNNQQKRQPSKVRRIS